ncbi:MAG: three-Cys-motif partner protein TcmP [Candidatus Hydrogenedentota bacterium]
MTSLQQFGGDWTREKLDIVGRYLTAYSLALKNKPFRKIYIDAFAGTGYRVERDTEKDSDEILLVPNAIETVEFTDGSARIALKTEPPFDEYVFIEKSRRRIDELEKLRAEFPTLSDNIRIHHDDCNDCLQRVCRETDWKNERAVAFLDPFGMQVDWETVRAIAETEAMDLWTLFPLGVGVNRMLKKNGDIRSSWCERLNKIFGTVDWYEEFYRKDGQLDLLRNEESYVKTASLESIGQFYASRLKGVFPRVAKESRRLCNSRGNPLYSLYFCCANPSAKAQALAFKIADHILGRI